MQRLHLNIAHRVDFGQALGEKNPVDLGSRGRKSLFNAHRGVPGSCGGAPLSRVEIVAGLFVLAMAVAWSLFLGEGYLAVRAGTHNHR